MGVDESSKNIAVPPGRQYRLRPLRSESAARSRARCAARIRTRPPRPLDFAMATLRDDAKVHELKKVRERLVALRYGTLSQAVALILACGLQCALRIRAFGDALPHATRDASRAAKKRGEGGGKGAFAQNGARMNASMARRERAKRTKRAHATTTI